VKFALQSRGTKAPADIGNELRILRKLRHPNIVMFHGACIDFEHEKIALVLEHVDGILMDSYIGPSARLVPSKEARAQCLVGVCRALMYLHVRQPIVVHGDIKPENIILQHYSGSCSNCGRSCQMSSGASVNAKLLDFGLARVQTRHAKALGGTLRWVGPEVFSRQEKLPRPAADVYSFGCLVYFAASDALPLASWPYRSISVAKKRGIRTPLQYPDMLQLEQCWPLVENATHHQPQRRPTMSQIYEELSQWPECQLPRVADKGDAALSFWPAIQHLQQTLTTQTGCLQHQIPCEMEHLQQGEQQQQQQQQQPEGPPAQNQAQRLDVEGVTTLRCPCFLETPLETAMLDVVMAMCRWNFPIPRTACCDYHTMVGHLSAVQRVLQAKECMSLEGKHHGSGRQEQCPECLGMNMGLEDSSSFSCEICGCKDRALQDHASSARDGAADIQAQHGGCDLAPPPRCCSL